jgi:hypothetical protein
VGEEGGVLALSALSVFHVGEEGGVSRRVPLEGNFALASRTIKNRQHFQRYRFFMWARREEFPEGFLRKGILPSPPEQ